MLGPKFEHIRVVQQIGSGRTKGDVVCDWMVFAINSNIFVIHCNYGFNRWSLDRGQKTINPLIPINSPIQPTVDGL